MKMKLFTIAASITLLASSASAAEWSFKFAHKGDKFETALTASTYDQAFEKAAKSCFRYFQNSQKMTDELGETLINICANPKAS